MCEFLSCKIEGARTSGIVLNKSGGRGYACLVPKVFRLSLLNILLAMGFFVDALYQIEKFPSVPSLLRVFLINRFTIVSFVIFFLHQLT